MGCYGIGVTRLMAAAVEILTPRNSSTVHWPRRIVPYQVAIIPPKVCFEIILTTRFSSFSLLFFLFLQKGSPEDANGNESTLGRLLKLDQNEWFVDDRNTLTIGYRLKDCQKLGIPIVITFGKRAVSNKSERMYLNQCSTFFDLYQQTEENIVSNLRIRI